MKGVLYWIGCWILTGTGLACNKSINANSNKAFVSVTNAIQDGRAVDLLFNGSSTPIIAQLPVDSTTGSTGNHYLPFVAGIHEISITPDGTIQYLIGNIAFQTNQYYSIFLYDSVRANSIRSLILSDHLAIPPDTLSTFRYLNLSPDTDTLYYVLTHLQDTVRDTIPLGFIPFIGSSPNPASHSAFNYLVHDGSYLFGTATLDSNARISGIKPMDSINLFGSKIYTLYTKGFMNGTGSDTLRVRMVQHN